jgi:eukaryotic-like serine/threonine-protein kinase
MTSDKFDSSSLPDALGPILEAFLARLRDGDRPSIQEYARRYPDQAAEILELFPQLIQMEQVGNELSPASRDASGSARSIPDQVAGSRPTEESGVPVLGLLGDYKILGKVGEGGMGIVYEAERVALRSRVALKVIHSKFRSRAD